MSFPTYIKSDQKENCIHLHRFKDLFGTLFSTHFGRRRVPRSEKINNICKEIGTFSSLVV